MRLSPELARAAYDFLRLTAPYYRWALPPGSEVQFAVNKSPKFYGDHLVLPGGQHRIRVTDRLHGRPDTLLKTMGHEMIHVHQAIRQLSQSHDAEFMRCWRLVCKHHGFDPLNP